MNEGIVQDLEAEGGEGGKHERLDGVAEHIELLVAVRDSLRLFARYPVLGSCAGEWQAD